MTGPEPSTIRRKVESWLAEKDGTEAIALRARPEWSGEPILTVSGVDARVVPCPTPMAARAALHDRRDNERLVLLTELADDDLGDGLLAHVSRGRVRSVDRWDLVRQMFRLTELDPAIADPRMGGGGWVADALTRYSPVEGWPAPSGAILTRDHTLRCLAVRLLGLDDEQLDGASLLQWSTDAQRVLEFSRLPSEVFEGITRYLSDTAGTVAEPIMRAVRAGHGIEIVPLGLVVAALWPTNGAQVNTDVAIVRTRLEPYFGGLRLSDAQAKALRMITEAWIDRARDTGQQQEAQRMIKRAEQLAASVDATPLLIASDVLPSGFEARLRAFANVLREIVKAGQPKSAAVQVAQQEWEKLDRHRTSDNDARKDTARMAVRALRWLASQEATGPATLHDAVLRQVHDDGWVDRARLDIFAGDADPAVAEAYRQLHRAIDLRRARHDQQFAELLAAATAADAEPGALLRVEDVLDRVVRPILEHRPVLLLVLDGMSVAASTELAESLTRSGMWLELTPDGGPRTGVLAALPTVTEASRCSLLSGRITSGLAHDERAAFSNQFPTGILLHKKSLRAGAGAALDSEVVAALGDRSVPLVAAVVNTIDDALESADPGTVVWGADNITVVRDLLAHARDRVVILVSDHGHVVDRGPDGRPRRTTSDGNRWRSTPPPAGEGEIVVHGPRVALGGGRVVLPWREELRYGLQHAGYHGGASPAEAVIPLIVMTSGDENAVPGWGGAPVASPNWWRESRIDTMVPTVVAPPARSSTVPEDAAALFEVVPPSPPIRELSAASPRPVLIDALLASDVYQRRRGTRAPLPDDRVAALLEVLLSRGGRATLDTMSAQAGVPAHRIGNTVTALRKLLQVEGYPVIEIDPDGHTVKLDEDLLIEQFNLELP